MCGITGWVDYARDPAADTGGTLAAMVASLAPRGPDAAGTWTDRHVALGHRRLAVIAPADSTQPMALDHVALTYNGEVYDFAELRADLRARGHRFSGGSDTEVVLRAYLEWGEGFVDRLDGMFALALWDKAAERLLLVRDRLGVKPLYYHPLSDGVMFGSEPKALLCHPAVRPRVGAEELCDSLLFLRTPGRVPLRGVHEVRPGHVVRVDRRGVTERRYWSLTAAEHHDDLATTTRRVRELLAGSVTRQLVSDVPLGCLLSGGLDSSTVSALASRALDGPLRTFDVDFAGHTADFEPDAIRSTPDGPYARLMAAHLGSEHRTALLDRDRLLDPGVRAAALRAWDLPHNFADLDVSLLLLFGAVAEHATVVLSGEAADELFAGYLWFTDERARAADTFPWLALGAHGGLSATALLRPEVVRGIRLDEYRADLHATALSEVDHLAGEGAEDRRTREIAHLTLTRWLPILLEKKDRMSMAHGVEGRVPFCDHRLVEYVFNVPQAMKNHGGREKALLRAAAADLLPEAVLHRRKAPYPTTQRREYDALLVETVDHPDSPLRPLLDPAGIAALRATTATRRLREFERVLVESVARLGAWVEAYGVDLTDLPVSA